MMRVESYSPPRSKPMVNQQDEMSSFKACYFALLNHADDEAVKARAVHFLHQQLAKTKPTCPDLPEDEQGLLHWLDDHAERVGKQYQAYLQGRHNGEPRRYFSKLSHALYFLNSIAPTKMVDGAWLYGFTRYPQTQRFSGLIHTYMEELGEGVQEKNHVALYKQLLNQYGLDAYTQLDDQYYQQGAIQLALGHLTEYFLPEAIGFNLGYEQLPLHLLITAYELQELGIDPHYFNLHITIDNAHSGHAKAAVFSVLDNIPLLADRETYFARVARGFQLNYLGVGTEAIIAEFDIDQAFISILQNKAHIGQYMHGNHCNIEGQSINSWLANPEKIPQFIQALESNGWIKRHQDPQVSAFWKLIEDDKARMFGVFNTYEKQVIYDWIAGQHAADISAAPVNQHQNQVNEDKPSLSTMADADYVHNIVPLRASHKKQPSPLLNDYDEDAFLFKQAMHNCNSAKELMQLLSHWMAPAKHHTAIGLKATRLYQAQLQKTWE